MLTEIEEVAENLTSRLEKGSSKAIFQLAGPVGTGKSACLERLADRLVEQTQLKPVIVAPPARHLDAGAVALADVATGLSSNSLLNGQLADWVSGDNIGRWADRVADIQRWIMAHNEEVVLLIDDPRAWGARNSDEDDFFRHRGTEAAWALTSLQCRRVIAGDMLLSPVNVEKETLSAPAIDPAWLAPPNDWGELAATAIEVSESKLLSRPLTPLQVRLLIAAAALSTIDKVTNWFEAEVDLGKGRAATSQMVAFVGEEMRSHLRLWDTWVRLSITRRAFDQDVLNALMPSSASDFERDLIRHCLLFGERSMRMHDDVKVYASRWRAEHSGKDHVKNLVASTTRKLFSIHRERFERKRGADAGKALQESLEAYHFASASGNAQLFNTVQPIFVEQLDALGWSLSVEYRKFKPAARAFEQALKWDEEDDYAHHYLAFNLDRLGVRVKDVERHYRRAAELDPQHPWWRSRLVIFLIGRGRISEARAEWDEALLDLSVGNGDSPALYEHLHCWVADALLDAAEPAFARDILEEVPARARGEAYAALYQRAEALLQLGEGDAVVPARRLHPGWWKDGPERLQYRFATNERLVKWLAGRVERRDKEGIHVRAALVESEKKEPAIVWTTISAEDFTAWCQDKVSFKDLAPGSFLEVGLYVAPDKKKTPVETVIRVLPDREWETPGMSELRSDRYLVDQAQSQ